MQWKPSVKNVAVLWKERARGRCWRRKRVSGQEDSVCGENWRKLRRVGGVGGKVGRVGMRGGADGDQGLFHVEQTGEGCRLESCREARACGIGADLRGVQGAVCSTWNMLSRRVGSVSGRREPKGWEHLSRYRPPRWWQNPLCQPSFNGRGRKFSVGSGGGELVKR